MRNRLLMRIKNLLNFIHLAPANLNYNYNFGLYTLICIIIGFLTLSFCGLMKFFRSLYIIWTSPLLVLKDVVSYLNNNPFLILLFTGLIIILSVTALLLFTRLLAANNIFMLVLVVFILTLTYFIFLFPFVLFLFIIPFTLISFSVLIKNNLYKSINITPLIYLLEKIKLLDILFKIYFLILYKTCYMNFIF